MVQHMDCHAGISEGVAADVHALAPYVRALQTSHGLDDMLSLRVRRNIAAPTASGWTEAKTGPRLAWPSCLGCIRNHLRMQGARKCSRLQERK